MNINNKEELKKQLYIHRNRIFYIAVFAIASIITIASVIGRNDKIVLVDSSQLVVSEKESIDVKNKDEQNRNDATVEDTHIETENTTGSKIVINTDILNVRKDATEDSEALGIAEQGDEFDIIAEDGEWIEIDYNGNNGYVKQEYVQFK